MIGETVSMLPEHSGNKLLSISVRRRRILSDALIVIGYNQSNLLCKLAVSFTGESGVDIGGLTREFSTLFGKEVSSSDMTEGKVQLLSSLIAVQYCCFVIMYTL